MNDDRSTPAACDPTCRPRLNDLCGGPRCCGHMPRWSRPNDGRGVTTQPVRINPNGGAR